MSTVNDLYANVISKDSISTHDWSKDELWQNRPESGWVDPANKDSSYLIQPAPGQALIIPAARVRYSRNAVMHSPLTIVYYVGESAVRQIQYKDQWDFFDRFDEFEVMSVENGSEIPVNIWSHKYDFDQDLILWSSTGTDSDGNPKLNKMIIKIEDNEPYKDSQGAAIGMARVRYLGCLVCVDPDYTG